MKNIQVRVDEKQANKAKKIFQSVGLDMPTAFRMFLYKSIDVGGLPFSATQDSFEDNYSPEQIAKLDRMVEEIEKDPSQLVGPFDNVEDLIKELRSN